MDVEEYIKQGQHWKDRGYKTDGCSFVGWLIPDKYTPACWSHDFARKEFIDLDDDDQSTNDYMFRKALRHLGMPDWSSNLIYYFTRSQGWVSDKTGIDAMFFAVLLMSAASFSLFMWFNA